MALTNINDKIYKDVSKYVKKNKPIYASIANFVNRACQKELNYLKKELEIKEKIENDIEK